MIVPAYPHGIFAKEVPTKAKASQVKKTDEDESDWWMIGDDMPTLELVIIKHDKTLPLQEYLDLASTDMGSLESVIDITNLMLRQRRVAVENRISKGNVILCSPEYEESIKAITCEKFFHDLTVEVNEHISGAYLYYYEDDEKGLRNTFIVDGSIAHYNDVTLNTKVIDKLV